MYLYKNTLYIHKRTIGKKTNKILVQIYEVLILHPLKRTLREVPRPHFENYYISKCNACDKKLKCVVSGTYTPKTYSTFFSKSFIQELLLSAYYVPGALIGIGNSRKRERSPYFDVFIFYSGESSNQ